VQVKALSGSALQWIHRTPPWRIDAVLATCFVAAGLATTGRAGAGYPPRDAVAVGLILAATLPYYARRVAPLPVFAVSVAAVAALFARGNAGGALPMVIAVGAYTVASYRPAREVMAAAVWLNAALVAMLVAGSPGFGVPEFVTSVAVYAATMLAGWTMQSRRLRLDAAEREQEEAAGRAAADERLRIAQELHDVVAHSLGVIAVQAGVGMHVLDADPAAARRALTNISRTSRSSLAEIRGLLGLVRGGESAAPYAPTAGLGDLDRLALEMADAGLPVTLEVVDDTSEVPPGVELAAYRIVQEALTNSLRHAHAHQATVRLEARGETVHLTVSDDGSGRNGGRTSGGHGLVGMRERVAVYGGSLEVGPAPEGGFRVDATLPYGNPAP
jgi:signal transduction histidine kinase